MKKKISLLLIGLMVFFTIAAFLIKKEVINKPKICKHCNIMLIDVDVLRGDELPCYGYSRNTTPNICEFAKNGAVFKDNYSNSIMTLPSMFSTITSLYLTFHKVEVSFADRLSIKIPTLAETLQKEGYRTVFIGKSDDPSTLNQENGGLRGYDLVTQDSIDKVVDDLSKSSQPWFVHYYNSDLHMPYLLYDGMKPMENLPAPKNMPISYSDFDKLLNTYLKKHSTEIFNKKAIEEYSSTILAPDKENDVSVTQLFYTLRNDPNKMKKYLIDGWKPIFDSYMGSFDKNNEKDLAYLRMMYDSNLNLVDKKLEPVLNKLKSKLLAKNTISIFMSDHGEAFGEHGTFTHDYNHHTELFYTPLIIKSPSFSGKVIDQTTSNIDIFPTILELAGIRDPGVLQGQSLVPHMKGVAENSRPFAISEYYNGTVLQNHNWFYYLLNSENIENSILYDKINDPLEKDNVSLKHPDLTMNLFKQADILRVYNRNYNKEEILRSEKTGLDQTKIKRIQKEGYF